ncbi:MAG: hypothetical protein A7315_12295 [Candidatus Altiarchaeales archaeon WOR_SM1_79]|nr:MAG: hypothetical protein A7315_12295 [Candidatus Altiarchaeales archaeon WOR_SM1_79]
MSVPYHKEIYSSRTLKLMVNFSGIGKDDIANASDLKLEIYAYDKNTFDLVFLETLDIEHIRKLFNYLNRISVIKDDSIEKSGKFVEAEKGLMDLKSLLESSEKQKVLEFIINNEIIPDDLTLVLQNVQRKKAIEQFEEMLKKDLTEHIWQKWFKENDWVLGSEFVRVLDERNIDTKNIADFLMKAYDGFLDIVEIKRPEGNLKFWMDAKDHGNYVPTTDLIKAITQTSNYIYEVEREVNSAKFLERMDNVKIIKPRSVLIFGRSDNWGAEQKEAYRILNSSHHNLTILTYDHVLERAKRII